MDAEEHRRRLAANTERTEKAFRRALGGMAEVSSAGEATWIWQAAVARHNVVNRMADLFAVISGVDARGILRQHGFGDEARPGDFRAYGLAMNLDEMGRLPRVADGDLDREARRLAEQFSADVARQAVQERVRLEGAETKTWMTMRDSRVRDDHAPMDGETVEIDEPFWVAGWPMMWPGDTSAPIELWANCRCSALLDV